MSGARTRFFDIGKNTRQVVDGGLAYKTIYDANSNIAPDRSFQPFGLAGFSRFCSGS